MVLSTSAIGPAGSFALAARLLGFAIASVPCQALGGVVSAQAVPNSAAPQWVTPAIGAPLLQHRTFASTAAGVTVSYHIYTPPMYDAEPQRRFPVVYWLHGSGGAVWPGLAPLTARLDSAIHAREMPLVLIVFPNGIPNSMWSDSKDGRVPMETVVVKELLPHIDATFRSIDALEGRVIEGFSMGGYGAARLGFKFPSLFGSVSILAGGPLQEEFNVNEAPRASPREAQALLDTVYGGDQEYFKSQSPWLLAERNADTVRGKRRIRLVVGERDNVLDNNRTFDARLTALNIPHAFVVLPGASHNLREVIDALGESNCEFYREAFGRAALHDIEARSRE